MSDLRDPLPAQFHNGVVCIGNFDGVHIGHRALIDAARAWADAHNAPVIALTFHPHPKQVFAPGNDGFFLTNLPEKTAWLHRAGIDHVAILPFHAATIAMPADTFIDSIIRKQLRARAVCVGPDFRFGHNRTGDRALLQRQADLVSVDVALLRSEHSVVSSSMVRQALHAADLPRVQRLLGRAHQFSATIARGDALGRKIGFPTANLVLDTHLPPCNGVYAIRCHICAPDQHIATAFHHIGVMNCGTRPTVDGATARYEAHILDFDGDLYDQRLIVALEHYIRGERKFAHLPELQQQIAKDCQTARAVLAV